MESMRPDEKKPYDGMMGMVVPPTSDSDATRTYVSGWSSPTLGPRSGSPAERKPVEWKRPTIRPLARLGELTTPTTISASTPEGHASDISELRRLLAVQPNQSG